MQHETVIVLDFGGQYNQLIARRVRENNVYCEIYSYKTDLSVIKAKNPKGIIFTGGPNSVYLEDSPTIDPEIFSWGVPVLGICYGSQLMMHLLGGHVCRAPEREYGKTEVFVDNSSKMFTDVQPSTVCWMSHNDYIEQAAPGFKITAHTVNCPVAAAENEEKGLYAVQFHPEVLHTAEGKKMLHNFVYNVCGCTGDWKMDSFVENNVEALRKRIGSGKVLCALSGGVDSSVLAAMLAKAIGKPVLLWGPQDTVFEADGTRYTDSQCGLFGMSRQLQRMNVPFTYIENCRIEDPIFTEGFLRFVGVACAVKNFKGMRVAQVGMRPKPFCSVIFNESDLMDKFDIHVIPVNLAVIQDKYNRILETRKDELAEGVAKLRQMYEIDDLSEPVLDKVYAFVLLYEEIFEEYNVAAVSAECWTAMQLMVGAMPCAAYPLLADMGYIIGCESDMHATLTQVVLKSLTLGQKKPFLGEFTTRHPSDRNVELLWHCGPFAYSLKKHGTGAKMVNMRQWMQVEDGHFTVARIDQDHGNYSIAVCECDSAEGPYTFGSYMWGKFKDLPGVERKLIEGPYIHHMSEIEGSLTDSIREFCKYVPGLTFDGLD